MHCQSTKEAQTACREFAGKTMRGRELDAIQYPEGLFESKDFTHDPKSVLTQPTMLVPAAVSAARAPA